MKTIVYLSVVLAFTFIPSLLSADPGDAFCQDDKYFYQIKSGDFESFLDKNDETLGYACFLAKSYFSELNYFDEIDYSAIQKKYRSKLEAYTGKYESQFDAALSALKSYHIYFGPGPDFD
jgi:hypothetical protein